jgi:hypothetical protein
MQQENALDVPSQNSSKFNRLQQDNFNLDCSIETRAFRRCLDEVEAMVGEI